MQEVKVVCECGQKYKFDVEPVGNRMPFAVECPVCKRDGTGVANEFLAQRNGAPAVAPMAIAAPVAPNVPPPPPVPPAGAPGLRINRAAHEAAPAPAPAATIESPIGVPIKPLAVPKPAKAANFSMPLGVVGAFVGAGVGTGAMFGFYQWAGFRFPLLGVGIGVLAGLGARWLGRGTQTTLGVITGVIAAVAVCGTLFLMYGTFPVISIISVVVSVSVAYRTASG